MLRGNLWDNTIPLVRFWCVFRRGCIQFIDKKNVSTGDQMAVGVHSYLDGTVAHLLFDVGQ